MNREHRIGGGAIRNAGVEVQRRSSCSDSCSQSREQEVAGAGLSHGAEDRVVPTDGRSILVILCFGMADLVELGLEQMYR